MAIKERDVVLVSTNEDNDTIIDMPVTRENCVEGLGRIRGTAYSVGDVALCAGSQSLQLICTKSGTTSLNELDITGKSAGDSITDGTVEWVCSSRMQAGVPVGFEYFTTNPNIPAGSIPLFGGEYSRTTYSDLWEWVQTQAGYLLTEEEWQAKASANDGNVPFYSTGDGSTTFRVPSLKCWVKGANGIEEVGSYLQAGLPNIKGKLIPPSNDGWLVLQDNTLFYSGTKRNDYRTHLESESHGNSIAQYFDASRYNAIYGNSDTVQPKSIVGMWLVKAYGTVTNVGSTDVASIAQGLTELETRASEHANKDLSNLTETGKKAFFPSATFVTIPSSSYGGYICPANGYVRASGNAASTNTTIIVKNKSNGFWDEDFSASPTASTLACWIPARKGDTVRIDMVAINNPNAEFYYAESEV